MRLLRADITVAMSPNARRAQAREWFLRGFTLSGRGFHGETYDQTKYPAFESLLVAEFERAWRDE